MPPEVDLAPLRRGGSLRGAYRPALLALSAAMIATGCQQGGAVPEADRLAWLEADSWYAPPPEDVQFSLAEPTQPSFWEVAASGLAGAEERVAEEPLVQLEGDPVASWFGVSLPAPPEGSSYYLARALYLNAETGGFSVFFENGNLLVSHACMGKEPATMKRTVLIVLLPAAPARAYVECGMSE